MKRLITAFLILFSIVATGQVVNTNISRYPRTNFVATEAIFLFSATNVSTTTSFGITASNLFYQITNSLTIAAGDAGGTNSRQGGSLNLTNWSNIPTGAMANVIAANFLTNWTDAVSNYVTTATNAAQVTNWITLRQPADTDLTNWALIPTGAMANVVSTAFLTNWADAISNYVTSATNSPLVTNWINTRQPASANLTNWSLIPTGEMANVVSTTFLTNWANAVSNYVTAATNAAQVTNWITLRQPADTDLTNWALIPTGAMANVVSTTFLTNWADAISNLHNRRSIFTQGVSVVTTATNWNFVNGSNVSVSAAHSGAGNVALTINVPTDFTNVYYVNPDSNLSSIMTNAPNNSQILIGAGAWTNRVSRYGSNNVLGDFHLQNRTNITIRCIGGGTLWVTNEGDHMVITNCSNIRIIGLTFEGTKVTNSLPAAPWAGIWIAASRDVDISECNFNRMGNHSITEALGLTYQSTNVFVHDNRFFWCGSWIDNSLGWDGSVFQGCSFSRFYRNKVIECATCVELYGSITALQVVHMHVEDNYFENPIKWAVADAGNTNNYNHVIARNLIIYNNGARSISSNAVTGVGAINFNNPRNFRVEDNHIYGANIGIFFPSQGGFSMFNSSVERNVISNVADGIIIGERPTDTGKHRGFRVYGNRIMRTSNAGITVAGSDMWVEANDIEDAALSFAAGIHVGTEGSYNGTNITIVNNRIRASPGVTPAGPAIQIDPGIVGSRHYGNDITGNYPLRIVDNGDMPRPLLYVEMTTGIKTNPFVIYNTNQAPVMFVDSRGFLVITNGLTNRIAAPTNMIAIGSDNFGGMNLPNWTDHNGLQSALQPFLGHEQVYWMGTGSGAVGNDQGILSSTNGGTVVSHPAPVESQMFMQQLDTAATSNACASRFSFDAVANAGAHDGSSKIGGYFFVATWASTNLIGQVIGGGAPRTFVGMTTRAAEDYTNMVVTTNATGQYIGLMCDASQSTNLFLTARDASGEFRTNTGIPFIATNVYKFYMMNAPTSRFVNWRLDDAYTGATRSGWFSNNVPTNFMRFGIATKNGTNRAHSVRYSRLYWQAPLVPPR